jgi:hypothetical protein
MYLVSLLGCDCINTYTTVISFLIYLDVLHDPISVLA